MIDTDYKTFEDYTTKPSVAIVYTGDSKGKTSASLGMLCRGLGAGWNVAFVQFIKHWQVNEHTFLDTIKPLYKDRLLFYKGGKGFFDAGEMSAAGITPAQHKEAAEETFAYALDAAKSGKYQLVICDEINNAVHDGLLTKEHLKQLLTQRSKTTNVCLTGRNFPPDLLGFVDIATSMTKIKHHFDEKFLANEGIDY